MATWRPQEQVTSNRNNVYCLVQTMVLFSELISLLMTTVCGWNSLSIFYGLKLYILWAWLLSVTVSATHTRLYSICFSSSHFWISQDWGGEWPDRASVKYRWHHRDYICVIYSLCASFRVWEAGNVIASGLLASSEQTASLQGDTESWRASDRREFRSLLRGTTAVVVLAFVLRSAKKSSGPVATNQPL